MSDRRLLAPLRLEHPVWMCGMRPFFLLAALSALGLVAWWGALLGLGLPVPRVAGGAFVWHAHELLLGFGLAALAGFTLTAVPEFTSTASFAPVQTRRLALAWIIGRIAFALSGLDGMAGRLALVIAGAAHLALLLGLAAMLAPRLWRSEGRRHLSFLWALLIVAALVAGFYVDALRGAPPMRWLHALLGALMALIVVAMSRISMRIVNRAIESDGGTVLYLARPPRRQLALLCIALYTVCEFAWPAHRIGGWLAWAAAAALLNLLNDWHAVGRALRRRWVLMLYLVYVLMAAGYGLIGWALLADGPAMGAGRHLLTVGALGLAVYVVICIAGRSHCGLLLDLRAWAPAGAVLIALGALLRALAAWAGPPWLTAAALSWCLAWALLLAYMAPVLWEPRRDGGRGCDGPAEELTDVAAGPVAPDQRAC
ncbi:MAG: NnrS family protein [Burkholderiaceae bacterium]